MAVAELFDDEYDTPWQEHAACKGRTRLFFPPKAERPQARARREAKAHKLCVGVSGAGAVPHACPPQPRVRLLGRRIRRGPPPRRLHRVGTHRRAGTTAAPGRLTSPPALRHPLSRVVSVALPRFAVVDLETCGLNTRRHRILQLGMVVVDADGTVIDQWSSLVKLGWPLQRVGPDEHPRHHPAHVARRPPPRRCPRRTRPAHGRRRLHRPQRRVRQ